MYCSSTPSVQSGVTQGVRAPASRNASKTPVRRNRPHDTRPAQFQISGRAHPATRRLPRLNWTTAVPCGVVVADRGRL